MSNDLAIPRASIGYFSATGPRPRNEDFAGAVLGSEVAAERRDVAAAIADGIGGAKGGRVAAETAVRGFLDGFWDVPETMEVRRAGARILDALNSWVHSQGQQDTRLVGMGCTFTALAWVRSARVTSPWVDLAFTLCRGLPYRCPRNGSGS